MREIKFRAWSSRENKMYERYMVLTDNSYHYLQFDFTLGDTMTPMQYTGLKDKNGKEIYEGDILKHVYNYSPEMSSDWYEDAEIIEVKLPEFFLKLGADLNKSDETLEEFVSYMEVIGNIYENPELLEYNA